MVDRTRLPSPAATGPIRFPAIQKTTLPNGLAVWSVEHRSVPVLTAVFLLTVGSASDPADRPGLASLTGDMLDEGAGGRSALDVHDALARMGAEFETEVGADATILTLTTLAQFRQPALDLLSDIVCRPSFDPGEFERVRQLRANRLRQLRDVPSAVADRGFATLLYGSHPYGHLAIGTETALEQVALEEVTGFHARAYRPSAATLVVVGDASHEEMRDSVSRAFGSWAGPDAEDRVAGEALGRSLREPGPPGLRLALIDRPGAAQSELRIGHVSAARSTPDYHALVLLNMVVGGQFVSRLNMNLREHKGFTYGVRSSFDLRRGPGPFYVQTSVHTAATAPAAGEVLEELRGLCGDRPVTAAELEQARAGLTRGYPRSFETAGQIARSAAQLSLYGLPDDYYETFVPSIDRLTLADVNRAAARHVRPDGSAVLIVGDRSAVESSLGTLGLGEPAVLGTPEL